VGVRSLGLARENIASGTRQRPKALRHPVWNAPESPAEGAAASGVLVPAFRVSVAPFLLASPTLMASLGLDLLPDRRVVSCPDKGIAPPVGRAKDLQQQGRDGIDVLEPLFQRVLVFGSGLHDDHDSCPRGYALPVAPEADIMKSAFFHEYAHPASIGSFRPMRPRSA